jgi:hypothetical protein
MYTQLVGKPPTGGSKIRKTCTMKMFVPNKPEESLIYLVLKGPVQGCSAVRMPDKNDAFSAADIETIRLWIAQGAKK